MYKSTGDRFATNVCRPTCPVVPSVFLAFASADVSEVLLFFRHQYVTFKRSLVHPRIAESLRLSHIGISVAWTDRHMIHIANYKK